MTQQTCDFLMGWTVLFLIPVITGWVIGYAIAAFTEKLADWRWRRWVRKTYGF